MVLKTTMEIGNKHLLILFTNQFVFLTLKSGFSYIINSLSQQSKMAKPTLPLPIFSLCVEKLN